MNFARDVVEAADPRALAVVELERAGGRREWTFADVARAARTLAAHLHEQGVRRGDVVLTLAGNEPDWVAAMVACFRQGYVVLPCTEQLRAGDLRLRLGVARARRRRRERPQRGRPARRGLDRADALGPGRRRLARARARPPRPSWTPRTRA